MSIEKLTGQVMADKTAAAIYTSLDEHMPPNILADNYLESKLSGNMAECLALELFARQLTMRYFHVPGVMDMLSAIERYKKMKKPGTGGARIHRDIADAIDQQYAAGDFDRLADGRIKFRVDRLAVTCKATKAAVMLLSAKYRRGIPKSRSGRYGSYNV
jgi:hypothetical protein